MSKVAILELLSRTRVGLKNALVSATCLVLFQNAVHSQQTKSVTTASDLFSAKSVWIDEDSGMSFTVLERRGQSFRGRLVVGEQVDRTFTGTVKNGKVTWLAKDVRAAKGGSGGDNVGTIRGDRIEFEYRSDGAEGTFTVRRRSEGVTERRSVAQSTPAKSDFQMDGRIAGEAIEPVSSLRTSLERLDQWISAPATYSQFEVTVRLFERERTFKHPKEARSGVETMLVGALDEVGRRYGVTIVTTEVRTATSGFSLHTKPPKKDDVLVFGVEALRFLAGYKPEAIRRIGLKRIVLCEEATLNGQPFPSGGGALEESLILGIKGIQPELVIRLHHELYHVFDVSTLGPRAVADAEWSALNPSGFTYRGLGDFFAPDGKPLPAFAGRPPEGFVTVYASASASEDKAETFFAMMARAEWLEAAMKEDRHIRAKVELIERRLRSLGPEFKPGYWRK